MHQEHLKGILLFVKFNVSDGGLPLGIQVLLLILCLKDIMDDWKMTRIKTSKMAEVYLH